MQFSEIAGTTRDFIEDEISIGGIHFRFIDTAGLRETTDQIEAMGVERARKKMEEASLILYLFDLGNETETDLDYELEKLKKQSIPFIPIGNKVDLAQPDLLKKVKKQNLVLISAKETEHINQLKDVILKKVNIDTFHTESPVVTNVRHHQSLAETQQDLNNVLKGIDSNLSNDLLAEDLKMALYHLGEITGEITTEDLLENIFSKFCIGK